VRDQTPQQKAQTALNVATTGLKLTIGPAITGWLLVQKDPAKQAHDAAMVYAAAAGVNSLATGATFTPAQVQVVVTQFLGSNDARYIALAQLVSNEYSNIYPLFNVAGTTPAKFLSEISLTAENAAEPFLTARATPTPTP
jgi:hypothetical protein